MGVVITARICPAPRVLWRALTATAEIMFGVTLMHSWAGGELPSVLGLVALTGVVYGATLLLLRGAVRLRVLVPFAAVAQVALHTVFAASTAHSAHEGLASTSAALHLTWQMALAHVFGTALTLLVWMLRRRAAEVILLSARQPCRLVLGRLPRRPTDGRGLLGDPGVLLLVAPHRGPPTAVLAFT